MHVVSKIKKAFFALFFVGVLAMPSVASAQSQVPNTTSGWFLGIWQHGFADFWESRGAVATNPWWDPRTVRSDYDNIDFYTEYREDRLNEILRNVQGVDTDTVLRNLFSYITRGATTEVEKHRLFEEWLRKAVRHPLYVQPVYQNGAMVTHPLALLYLGEMRCGHVARVAADVYDALGGGRRGRLVQLGGHVIAEVYYQDADGVWRWHILDADIMGGAGQVRTVDNRVPSMVELSQSQSLRHQLDALSAYAELDFLGRTSEGSPYPSYFYLSRNAYSGLPGTLYYTKDSNWRTRSSCSQELYGWNCYQTTHDPSVQLQSFAVQFLPPQPHWNEVTIEPVSSNACRVYVQWDQKPDPNNDLHETVVHINNLPRGASFGNFMGKEEIAKAYWRPQPLTEDSYEVLTSALVSSRTVTMPASLGKSAASFTMQDGETAYVTLEPKDRYGLLVGRRRYQWSNELTLHCDTSSYTQNQLYMQKMIETVKGLEKIFSSTKK